MLELLDDIVNGDGTEETIEMLLSWPIPYPKPPSCGLGAPFFSRSQYHSSISGRIPGSRTG